MGDTDVKVKVYNQSLLAYEDLELLVDSGSTYTWISKDILERPDIERGREKEFKTIEGRMPKRSIGKGFIEFLNGRVPTILVFAEERDAKAWVCMHFALPSNYFLHHGRESSKLNF